MSTIFKAAFIFVAPAVDPLNNSSWVRTEEVHVKTIAVANYKQASELVEPLIEEGIKAIELCAGFGHRGVAEIVKIAGDRLHVGVVRFDKHPCLDFASGDELF